MIAFDARIVGPHGIRVGMKAHEVATALPGYFWNRCMYLDEGVQCELRIKGRPTPCESFKDPRPAEPVFVWFATQGVPESDLPENQEIIGVVLVMRCRWEGRRDIGSRPLAV